MMTQSAVSGVTPGQLVLCCIEKKTEQAKLANLSLQASKQHFSKTMLQFLLPVSVLRSHTQIKMFMLLKINSHPASVNSSKDVH